MILIADSGSTKTTWCLLEHNRPIKQLHTLGINPFFLSKEELIQELTRHLVPSLQKSAIQTVYFYGAGCVKEKQSVIQEAISCCLGVDISVYVYSDLLGAARSLCGNEPGIACILGTGSNSCFYNGQEITKNVPPLGFILGDEGSGAALGLKFLSYLLKGLLPRSVKRDFDNHYQLTQTEILNRVYTQPFPNRFLSGFVPFIHQHKQEAHVYQLVEDSFILFFKKNIMQYDYLRHKVYFTGSVAYFLSDILQHVAGRYSVQIGQITQSPMEGLVLYHQCHSE